MESKCQNQIKALRETHQQVRNDAHAAITRVLCTHLRQKGLSPQEFHKQLSNAMPNIPMADFCKFLKTIPDAAQLKKYHFDAGLSRYSSGISKLRILDMLQEYLR